MLSRNRIHANTVHTEAGRIPDVCVRKVETRARAVSLAAVMGRRHWRGSPQPDQDICYVGFRSI